MHQQQSRADASGEEVVVSAQNQTKFNQPRLKTCSLYLYQRGEVVEDDGRHKLKFLIRQLDGVSQGSDFGEQIDSDDRDLSIFYTVARCLLQKTGTLLSTRHLTQTATVEGLSQSLEAYNAQGFDFQVDGVHLMQDVFRDIFVKKVCHLSVENEDSHLVVFYPLQPTEVSDVNLTKVNEAYSLNDKFKNLKLSWASLSELPNDHKLHSRAHTLHEEKPIQEEGFDYILLNADDRDHVQLMNEAMFHGTCFRPGDRWGYFNAFDGKLPTREQLKEVKAVFFPGSRFSVYDDIANPWIKGLKELARIIYFEFPTIKMVGICFGHQLLTAAFGGKVERMEEYLQTIEQPLYLGKETLELLDPMTFFQDTPYVAKALKGISETDLKELGQLVVNCCHGDHGAILPQDFAESQDFKLIASSKRTLNELWIKGDRILSMQAHPELNNFLIQKFIIDRLHKLGRFTQRQKEANEAQLYTDGHRFRRHVMMRIIQSFIGTL